MMGCVVPRLGFPFMPTRITLTPCRCWALVVFLLQEVVSFSHFFAGSFGTCFKVAKRLLQQHRCVPWCVCGVRGSCLFVCCSMLTPLVVVVCRTWLCTSSEYVLSYVQRSRRWSYVGESRLLLSPPQRPPTPPHSASCVPQRSQWGRF